MGDKVYFFMDIFSITIVFFILLKVFVDTSMKKNLRYLLFVSLISEIFMFSIDAVNNLSSDYGSQIFIMPIWLNSFFHFMYFFNLAIVSFSTFVLIDETNDNYLVYNSKTLIISSLPALALMVISFISMFNGWMFTINPDSTYSRGPLNFLQMVFPAIYVVLYLFIAIHHMLDKHYYAARKTYRNVLLYCFAPITGGSLQFIFPKVPFLIASLAFSTLMIYVYFIQNQISFDYLTGLYNRSSLDKYLTDKLKNHNKSLYLLMMDIDYFKNINDTFGHIEGDKALKYVGETLKNLGKRTEQFAARFGGDEFAMVLEINDKDLDKYIDKIRLELEVCDYLRNYNVKLSIGYAKLTSDIDTIPKFIAKADEMLYKAKMNRS